MLLLLLYLKVECDGLSHFLFIYFFYHICRRVEAGGKPDFPKGLKEDLVFIVCILKINAISFGDFISPSISPSLWTVKTFITDNKEDISQFPVSF